MSRFCNDAGPEADSGAIPASATWHPNSRPCNPLPGTADLLEDEGGRGDCAGETEQTARDDVSPVMHAQRHARRGNEDR
jgi:hypothetical protein